MSHLFLQRQNSKWEWECFSWGSYSELTSCHVFHILLPKASQEAAAQIQKIEIQTHFTMGGTMGLHCKGHGFRGEVENWDPFPNKSTGARVKCQDQDWLSLCLSHFSLSTSEVDGRAAWSQPQTRTELPQLQKQGATALMMVWTESSQSPPWTLQILLPN